MKVNYQIDNVDLKILNILSKNAKMPYTEVAKKVFVSFLKKFQKNDIYLDVRLDNKKAIRFYRPPFLQVS